MASSSSSSFVNNSQYCPRWAYDVFLSFRGDDTRRTFTGHLYEGLKNRGIYTFQDDKRLDDGDSIPRELLKAIEESQVALIIFSKNYATSSWCLNELVKIMECKEKNGQIVIPIFYQVDPSHVRHQSESFAEAFAKHESRFKDDVEGIQKVQVWRTALTAASNLKGRDIRDGIEADCIQHIVDQVSSKLCNTSISYLQNVVGINTHLEKVKSLLEMEVNDVRIVGIWGMGGVGKTTIARAIFDTIKNRFDGACFLADIKENKGGMHSLQNILVSELLRKKDDYVNNKEDGKHKIARRLRFKKVLVVLDDIDHSDHLDNIAGDLDWFGKGSRIIATTRNKEIIGKNNAVYEVTTLLKDDAIQLFSHYAFRDDEALDEHIKKLALEVVSHANGLPLALKLWGIMFHNRDTTMWRDSVDMIKRESSLDIVENLKISFEGLQDKEKTIFLDIACFFRGDCKDKTLEILESYDFGARVRLHGLIEKSLVFITEYNKIEMHDLIQDMGRYVVEMQKDSGKPTRLCKLEDFEDVMANNVKAMAVEVIWIPLHHGEIRFSKEAMKNMHRLRILCLAYFSNENGDSIEYLPNNLRWVNWLGYHWNFWPQNFNPTRLVHLDLSRSSLHHLWNETKQLPSLRMLDLSESKSLKRTPDFTGMPNLEYLDLSNCRRLEKVHHSLGCCRKLIEVNLKWCESLTRFSYVNVESLKSLNLGNCYSLEKLPEFLGIMKLKLEIETSCSDGYPPVNIHLQPLLINMWACSKLESLPKEIGDLENLEYLDASHTLISRPPSSIFRLNKLKKLAFAKEKSEDRSLCFAFPRVNEGLRSLEELNLSYCNLIDGGLPEDIGSLSSLKKLNLRGNNFEHLPQSIAQLGALRSLDLSHCNKLKELPCMPNLDTLDLRYCNLIDGGLLEDIGCLSSLKILDLDGNNFEHLPRSIAQLGTLETLNLLNCKRLKELPEIPQQLETIDADWSNDWICNSLFQKISSLQHDISVSDSLSLRVFTSWQMHMNIPSWFHHRGLTGRSISVNLPKNWYVSDNFLGFAVCCSGELNDGITAHLDPLCDDGMSSMTQKFALYNHSEYAKNFLLVPLAGLWDASEANGKTPNDYGCFRLNFSGVLNRYRYFGVRLLYKDE